LTLRIDFHSINIIKPYRALLMENISIQLSERDWRKSFAMFEHLASKTLAETFLQLHSGKFFKPSSRKVTSLE
jgi:hypothetical protein